MTQKTKIGSLLNVLLLLVLVLFFTDTLDSFDIKHQGLKTFVYYGVLILTPFSLVLNYMYFKKARTGLLWTVFSGVAFIGVLLIGPMRIAFASSSWKTQTILYQHLIEYKRVEFQVRDVGALGYEKRTVKVFYWSDLFMSVSPVDSSVEQNPEWIRVDRTVNESGLK